MRRFILAAALLLAAADCSHTPDGAPDDGGKPNPPNKDGWWRGGVFYEIFVRSFSDSDGDGIGDLRGLTAHLDYLNDGDPKTSTDLGVSAIWLMPIQPSPSYHGYDVTNYRDVNPQYGTLADFDALLAAAHQRGIKVIIDFVLNHSSSQHPWFQDSKATRDGEHRNWYSWRDSPPSPPWHRPWDTGSVWHQTSTGYFYALFWDGMPDLNLGNPAVEDEMVSSMRFWLDRGVNGFRLDAVRHFFEADDGTLVDVPATHAFSKRLRTRLLENHPTTLLVGEAWTELETVLDYYGAGDEYQMAFAFSTAAAVKTAVNDGARAELVNVLSRTEIAYAGKDRGFDAPFLANHDMTRYLKEMGGDVAKARLAAAVLMALPGTPFLYYGEEIGMQGGVGSDELKRTPLRWNAEPGYGFTNGTPWYREVAEAPGVDVASQQKDPGSLWNTYRELIALRGSEPALSAGDATRPEVVGGGRGAFALLRTLEGKRVLFVVNLWTEPTGPFKVQVAGTPRVLLDQGLDAPPTGDGAALDLGLKAQSFAYFALE